MTWTTPRTWSAGEVMSASLLNTHLRDNESYLLSGMQYYLSGQNAHADYSLGTGTTWTNIDSTGLGMYVTITPASTRVLIIGTIYVKITSSGDVNFDWKNNNSGVRSKNDNIGVAQATVGVPSAATPYFTIPVIAAFTGLTPSTAYTFYLQYYLVSGAVAVGGGSGAHPAQAYAIEY